MPAAAGDNLTKDIGRFVAVKSRIQRLNVQVQLARRPFFAEMSARRTQDVGHVGGDVGKRYLPAEMPQYPLQTAAQTGIGRVESAEYGWVGVDKFRAGGRFDEDKPIVEIFFGQHFSGYGIEKGFRQFGLFVIHQEGDVFFFGLRPQLVGRAAFQTFGQNVGCFRHAAVVHLDAVGHQILYAFPVAPFKQGFGLGGLFAEQAVVFVEPGQHGFGNFTGRRGVCRFFHCSFSFIAIAASVSNRARRKRAGMMF